MLQRDGGVLEVQSHEYGGFNLVRLNSVRSTPLDIDIDGRLSEAEFLASMIGRSPARVRF